MFENKSVHEIISIIHKKEVSVKEVVSFYLDRIKKFNSSLNAIVSIKDEEKIIKEAKDKDENFDKNKPLLGLPLAPKDLLDVVGFPTTYGFPGYKNYFPKKNSLIVDRLVDAGAIIIGKTNTAELGVGGHTTNRLFGETSNPYNLSKSAGGSSGGAGVAVAANLLPFADGTDMMGSCRTPAAYTNIYGFRPTPGLIPDYRTNSKKDKLPILSTPGCMARTPNDLSIILDNVSGEHKSDPYSFSLKNKLINFYKIPSNNVFVFHDELDIPFGNIRLKKGGGNAGHNGLKSLVNHLKNDFIRVRIGIGHPGSKELVSNYVLSNFSSNTSKSLNLYQMAPA